MGHYCDYFGEFKVIRGKLELQVTASWKNKNELVYKENEDGKIRYRYINLTMCGYTCTFPGEALGYYYGYQAQPEVNINDNKSTKRFNLNLIWSGMTKNLKYIEKKLPELKYLIAKYKWTSPYMFLDLVKVYRKNQSIESLVAMGYTILAKDKRLSKLSKEKKLQVVNFVKNEIPSGEIDYHVNLTRILFCINHKVSWKDSAKYSEVKYNYKLGSYLVKQKISIKYYEDYIQLCGFTNKPLDDDYWRYPSKFLEKSHQVEREYEEICRLRNIEEQKKEKAKQKLIFAKLKKEVSKYVKFNDNVNGYDIFVTPDIKVWEKQAKVLHQCIMSMKYYEKFADGKSIIAFVQKDKNPVATIELDPSNYKIRQFYANEEVRSQCMPTNEVKCAMNLWLAQSNLVFKGA